MIDSEVLPISKDSARQGDSNATGPIEGLLHALNDVVLGMRRQVGPRGHKAAATAGTGCEAMDRFAEPVGRHSDRREGKRPLARLQFQALARLHDAIQSLHSVAQQFVRACPLRGEGARRANRPVSAARLGSGDG